MPYPHVSVLLHRLDGAAALGDVGTRGAVFEWAQLGVGHLLLEFFDLQLGQLGLLVFFPEFHFEQADFLAGFVQILLQVMQRRLLLFGDGLLVLFELFDLQLQAENGVFI